MGSRRLGRLEGGGYCAATERGGVSLCYDAELGTGCTGRGCGRDKETHLIQLAAEWLVLWHENQDALWTSVGFRASGEWPLFVVRRCSGQAGGPSCRIC
jgi:hypothetical protein